MNPYGSYRTLLGNSIAALSAAIEVYNKPGISYREESFVILFINAWELLLKAILSNSRVRIFYKKKRGVPYRTYSIDDVLQKSRTLFPAGVNFDATAKNLELLTHYRDNCIHFYNKPGFGAIIYSLSQTAVANYSDLVQEIFGRDLTHEITLSLLPLGLAPPVDPVEFLKGSSNDPKAPAQVKEFTQKLRDYVAELEQAGCDTGRLLTTFRVRLESTKKLTSADLVVGVQGEAPEGGHILVQRPLDPNKTHRLIEADIIGSKRGRSRPGLGIAIGSIALGQFQFRAIGHHFDVLSKPNWSWRDDTGAVTRYSQSYVDFIKKLSPEDLQAAIDNYKKSANKRKQP